MRKHIEKTKTHPDALYVYYHLIEYNIKIQKLLIHSVFKCYLHALK